MGRNHQAEKLEGFEGHPSKGRGSFMSKSVKTQHFEAEIQSGDAVLGIFGLTAQQCKCHMEKGPASWKSP